MRKIKTKFNFNKLRNVISFARNGYFFMMMIQHPSCHIIHLTIVIRSNVYTYTFQLVCLDNCRLLVISIDKSAPFRPTTINKSIIISLCVAWCRFFCVAPVNYKKKSKERERPKLTESSSPITSSFISISAFGRWMVYFFFCDK